jgi:hypothetical protein
MIQTWLFVPVPLIALSANLLPSGDQEGADPESVSRAGLVPSALAIQIPSSWGLLKAILELSGAYSANQPESVIWIRFLPSGSVLQSPPVSWNMMVVGGSVAAGVPAQATRTVSNRGIDAENSARRDFIVGSVLS